MMAPDHRFWIESNSSLQIRFVKWEYPSLYTGFKPYLFSIWIFGFFAIYLLMSNTIELEYFLSQYLVWWTRAFYLFIDLLIDVTLHLLIFWCCSFSKTWGKFLKLVVPATHQLLRQQLCMDSSTFYSWFLLSPCENAR